MRFGAYALYGQRAALADPTQRASLLEGSTSN
jgi:hypothetical protein